MGVRLELPAGGVAAVRFGISPLFELAALVRRLRQGVRGPLAEQPWTRWQTALDRLHDSEDAAMVLQLMRSRQGSVIWVAGTPSMRSTFADDLAAVTSLPDDILAAEVERYVGAFAGRDRPPRPRIESGLRQLWDGLLADQWGAVRSSAEHEIARVTDVLRAHGWAGVFQRIGDGISWDGHALQLSGLTAGTPSSASLVLAPSVFALSGPIVRVGVTDPSVVFFPARGVGLLFSTATEDDPDGLSALLGPNRARVLLLLQHPTTVSRLRELLGLSLGSLSRHLSILTATRLATSRRVGRTVEYEASDLGRALIAAQDLTDSGTA